MASAVAATDECKMQAPPLATVYFIVKKAPYSLAEIAPQGVDRPSDNSGTVRDTPQEDGGVLDHTLPATLAGHRGPRHRGRTGTAPLPSPLSRPPQRVATTPPSPNIAPRELPAAPK